MKKTILTFCLSVATLSCHANTVNSLDRVIKNFARHHQINSISVGINRNKKQFVIQYGKQKRYPINSMTKTFTTLLLAHYVNINQLKLTDKLKKYFPTLNKTQIGDAELIHFATHTSGLPLNIAIPLKNRRAVFAYLRQWKSKAPVGSRRIYSNLGIGMLGYVLEKITQQSYASLVRKIILQPYGMKNTSVNPTEYHFFSNDSVFIASDGIVSTAKDMNTYLRLMMKMKPFSPKLSPRAVNTVLTGYYQTPFFTVALGWQEYPWPIAQRTYLQSASLTALNTEARAIKSPSKTDKKQLFVKTGLGHHFSSIMAFIPKEKISVIILINKDTATRSRMKLAYELLKILNQTRTNPSAPISCNK